VRRHGFAKVSPSLSERPAPSSCGSRRTAMAVVASVIVTWPLRWVGLLGLLQLGGCVPSDPPGESRALADPAAIPVVTVQRWRPHSTTAHKPDAIAPPIEERSAMDHAQLAGVFRDSFERETLGPEWATTSDRWRIDSGKLCGQSNRNHPLWLKRRIPANARITFTAQAKTNVGDLKVEAWGNGRSFAKGVSYDDATSYVFVLGGWKNQLHVLARLNEHDPQRLELRVDPTGENPRLRPVLPGVNYRFAIERRDKKTLIWRVDDVDLFVFEDKEPLVGPEHDHFGFNNWESPVCFDDLTITPLAE